MRMQGTLLLVQSERRGSSLRSWSGTVLTVDSGADFADEGGSFTVAEDPTVYTYTGVSRSDVDESAELLGVQSRTVTSGFVAVHPEQVDVWAEVEVAGAAGAVQATVPHNLRPLLADGAHGMSVTIERVGEVWQVADILGQRAEIESGALSEEVWSMVSANGGNHVTHAITAPDQDGRVAGDTWFMHAPTLSSPVTGQWSWSGSVWVSIALSHQVISSVDLGTATVGFLDGDRIEARSVKASHLQIAPGNLWPDPLLSDAANWGKSLMSQPWAQGGVLYLPGSGVATTVWYKQATRDAMQLTPGATYSISARVRFGATAGVPFLDVIVGYRKLSDGALSSVVSGQFVRTAANAYGTGGVTRTQFTVPEDSTGWVTLGFRVPASAPDGDAALAQINVQSAIDASLVVEGAIDGFTITGPTIQTVTTANRGLKITKNEHLRAWDASGNQTVHINGTSNYMVGEFRTNRAGAGPGVVLVNASTAGTSPGIWFSQTSQALGTDAAVYSDGNQRLVVRAPFRDGWPGQVWTPGYFEAEKGIQIRALGPDGLIAATLEHQNSRGRVIADEASFDELSARFTGSLSVWNHLRLRYITTVSYAANTFLDANNLLYKTGSSRKLKINIQDQATEFDPWALLNVPARIWSDRAEVEARRDKLNGVENTLGVEAHGRIPGVVAEEVAEAGLEQFVTRNPDTGEVEGVMYDRLWTPLIPIVKDLLARVEALEQPTVIEGEVV